MKGFLRRLRHPAPKLDWIQIEITTRCDGRCVYCPQASYRDRWQNLDLPLPAFRELLPSLSRTGLIHLQGWGEPLLHPGFLEMVRLAKQTGARVGTTSNANRLTPGTAEKLVEAGLDLIGLSLAGTTPETNDPLRPGTSMESVLQAVEALQSAKRRLGRHTPSIHLAFMLLRSRLDELERLPGFLADLGVAQAVVSSLALVPSSGLWEEAELARDRAEWTALNKRADEAQTRAAEGGTVLECQLVSPLAGPKPCNENIPGAAVVGADGRVSPCVMASLPVSGKALHAFGRKQVPVPRAPYGSIHEQGLRDILERPEAKRFRRRIAAGRPPAMCRNCLKSRVVSNRPRQEPAGAPVPDL